MEQLKELYNNKHMLKELLELHQSEADKLALKEMYAGKDVSWVPNSKKIMDNLVKKLDDLYGEKTDSKPIRRNI